MCLPSPCELLEPLGLSLANQWYAIKGRDEDKSVLMAFDQSRDAGDVGNGEVVMVELVMLRMSVFGACAGDGR